MADQNTSSTQPKAYSEVLTPTALFAARNRSHKIPVRGQKDFIPDGSDEQRQRLEQAFDEHWSLISEERVERLGSLVKGLWIPEERIIELQTPAGKFWQTMGFSANGKQYLLPEEALFLMECGNVQVFHQGLPFSIQDGYENFLSSNSITFKEYLVYGHLKRLGYVVLRFDPSSEPTAYARQLNLPVSKDRGQKRKRSPTPPRKSSDETTAEQMEQDSEGEKSVSSIHQTETLEEKSRCEQDANSKSEMKHGAWWSPPDVSVKASESSSSSCRWDFSSIHFPDVGSVLGFRSEAVPCLNAPDPCLLPGAVTVSPCDIALWRRRINLRDIRMSRSDQRKEDEKYWRQEDINKDPEVRRSRTWSEYHQLLAKRRSEVAGRSVHLWNKEVTPLHNPTETIPHEELLEKISIIKSVSLLDGTSCLKPSESWRISFSVFQPDSVSSFKKSSPGRPYVRMVVCSFDGPVPDLSVLKQLSAQSPEVPLVFAAVDHGDISFYTFKDFHLPRDVFP